MSGLKEERDEAINEKNTERIVPDWEQTNEEKELVAQELSEGLSNLILEFQGRKKSRGRRTGTGHRTRTKDRRRAYRTRSGNGRRRQRCRK